MKFQYFGCKIVIIFEVAKYVGSFLRKKSKEAERLRRPGRTQRDRAPKAQRLDSHHCFAYLVYEVALPRYAFILIFANKKPQKSHEMA